MKQPLNGNEEQVWVLHKIAGMSREEIAIQFSTTAESVRRAISRYDKRPDRWVLASEQRKPDGQHIQVRAKKNFFQGVFLTSPFAISEGVHENCIAWKSTAMPSWLSLMVDEVVEGGRDGL